MEGRDSGPYFDPDFDSIFERINPRVCIDNETREDCTLIKVDSANRHGILLEMVQLLTDLDLVISKSYISSDGGWLMDVFHVTDQLGRKLIDPVLIRFLQQSLVKERTGARSTREEVTTCLGKLVGAGHLASEYAVVEITATDRPGLLSEIAAVVAELYCHVACAQAWTHNSRSAIVFYLTEEATRKAITDANRLAHIEQQIDNVLVAHHGLGERRGVKVSGPTPDRVHSERRLHQLMYEDGDYEAGPPPPPADISLEPRIGTVLLSSTVPSPLPWSATIKTRASVDSWHEKGYSVVNIHCRDRPKLLFDTVCTLTDMQYAVFHASVGAHGPLAVQEYYIRQMNGCTLDSESERQRVSRCLVAAVERRVSHGLRLEITTTDRGGLLADVTRVLRENGFSLTRMECATRGERAVGTFYVVDYASDGGEVDARRVNAVRKELGESVTVKVSGSGAVEGCGVAAAKASMSPVGGGRSATSLGSLLWSHLGRLSGNFGSIRS
ncbi:ACT domain-containing protein ACR3-like [Canna indica]|uniref:ACT domain-containing protein ACR n=1 Tax=Canna indica TaxID=4628 RepID=A0AAQ3K6N8_9LILI|nr:ACT domain-containing protein ACR3-like [Canna indica]